MFDNFQIQFGREEFCLVTGLKFRVEYWAYYNDEDEPIPFGRRVFPSSLNGKHITGKNVEELIKSKSFYKLDDDDAVSLCCIGILQLVLLGVEDRHAVPNWILRLANDRDGWGDYPWGSYVWPTLYYRLRDANVRRWLPLYATEPTNEVDKKTYSIFGFTWAFNGRVLAERLIPDEIEAGSGCDLSGFQSIQGGPSSFQTPANNSFFNMGTPINWQTPMPSHPGSSNWQSQMPAYTPTPNWQPPIPSHPGDAGLCNPQMNAWIEILIRSRPQNAEWTVSKSRTACVHPENNRFMVQTDPHIIGTLDGSTRLYPSWKYVNWVYMTINVGGNHWVTGAVNLPYSNFYVFDSMESERTRLLLEHQIKAWTPVINGISQMRGYFDGYERQPHNFIVSYNQGWGFSVPQQSNFQDCGSNKLCWLRKVMSVHRAIVPREKGKS
ncbi:phospholipase-like protein [Tanacetum coccineum]